MKKKQTFKRGLGSQKVFISPHVCACPKLGPRFPMSYVMVLYAQWFALLNNVQLHRGFILWWHTSVLNKHFLWNKSSTPRSYISPNIPSRFFTWVKERLPLVGHKLPTLLEHFNSAHAFREIRNAQAFFFCVMSCRLLVSILSCFFCH